MKRSEINELIRNAMVFMGEHHFALPAFAHWTQEDWKWKGPECREIAQAQLGWDITDFGSGDFARRGLLLFTVRNGVLQLGKPVGKSYAEKIMVVREGQETPTHFHFQKMEDIINRGGGELVLELWNADDAEGLSASEVQAGIDGVLTRVPAGGRVVLRAGESITLTPRMYHRFWAQSGMTLVGEVSRVNDDQKDNRFHEPLPRFPGIEEDEPPLHLLVTDYAKYYRYSR